MKTKLLVLMLSIGILLTACEKDNHPYQGMWSFNFFHCYDYPVTIDNGGYFEFTGALLIYQVGMCDYVVKGNVQEDSHASGNVYYNNQVVGTFTGNSMGLGDTILYGTYNIEYNGQHSCSSQLTSWSADKSK